MILTRRAVSAGLCAGIGAGFGLALLPRRAFAAFPERPIQLIVPFAAGGNADIVGRITGQIITEQLKQPVVVQDRAGAGGSIGAQMVARAEPDGYTLLLGSAATLAIGPAVFKNIGYDPITSFTPVGFISNVPYVMVAGPKAPAKSVQDVIAYAKANPGKLSIASSGIGTSLHLSGELFKAQAGVQFIHVPYRGSAPALTDVMSGQIQGMFDNVTSSFELVRSGKLRAIGVTTRERSAVLPDVPPIGDTLAGFETSSVYGVGAPRGTPQAIVDLLNREINAAFEDPLIQRRLTELGVDPITGSASQFGALLATETERWRKIVERSGQRKE